MLGSALVNVGSLQMVALSDVISKFNCRISSSPLALAQSVLQRVVYSAQRVQQTSLLSMLGNALQCILSFAAQPKLQLVTYSILSPRQPTTHALCWTCLASLGVFCTVYSPHDCLKRGTLRV